MATKSSTVPLSTTTSSSVATAAEKHLAIENLYPVLIQCFAMILAGYVVVRSKLVSPTETQGIKMLLLYFLTPAILLKCLIGVEFGEINWRFIGCIFLIKCLLFAVTATVTMLLSKDLAKAGLYGICVTASNDLAMGYPVVYSLYNDTKPAFPQYLYVIVPISFTILNPIACALIEISRQINSSDSARGDSVQSKGSLALLILKNLLKNPLVATAVIGLMVNALRQLMGGRLPAAITTPIDGFASAFVTVALFSLGASFGGSGDNRSSGGRRSTRDSRQQHNHTVQEEEHLLVTPVLLVLTKSLLFPLLLKEAIALAEVGVDAQETEQMAIFGFLYGCLPSAPTVYVLSTYAGVAVKQVSEALVLSTFLSGPWIFLTAQMIAADHLSQVQFKHVFVLTRLTAALISAVLGVVTVGSLIHQRKLRRTPHRWTLWFTLILIFFSVSQSLSDMVESSIDFSKWVVPPSWSVTVAARCCLWIWAPIIGIELFCLRAIGLCFVLKHTYRFFIIGLGVSISVSFFVSFSGDVTIAEKLEIGILLLSSCITCASLILQQRYGRHRCALEGRNDYSVIDMEDIVTDRNPSPSVEEDNNNKKMRSAVDTTSKSVGDAEADEEEEEDSGLVRRRKESTDGDNATSGFWANEDERLCAKSRRCSERQRRVCQKQLMRYELRTVGDAEPADAMAHTSEVDNHIKLLAAVCVTMVLRFFVETWKLVASEEEMSSTVFEQVEIVEAVLTNGQGVLLWLLFGVQWERLQEDCTRLCRRLRYGTLQLQLPKYEQLDDTTRRICEKFARNHLSRCQQALCANKRIGLKMYTKVLPGSRLVDWLTDDEGLAPDRVAALRYGRRLVLGGLLRHIAAQEHFHDSPNIYYTFNKKPSFPSIDMSDDEEEEEISLNKPSVAEEERVDSPEDSLNEQLQGRFAEFPTTSESASHESRIIDLEPTTDAD